MTYAMFTRMVGYGNSNSYPLVDASMGLRMERTCALLLRRFRKLFLGEQSIDLRISRELLTLMNVNHLV